MPDRTLILMRHAKSDWSGPEADIDRPLAERGLHQAPRAGKWLAHNIRKIDLAVVSPAKRARSTWKLASAELDHKPPIRIDDDTYAASAGELLGVVRDLPDDVGTVVLITHNPGLEDLLSRLTGEEVPMPTSALAVVGWNGSWADAGHSAVALRASGRPPTGGLSTP